MVAINAWKKHWFQRKHLKENDFNPLRCGYVKDKCHLLYVACYIWFDVISKFGCYRSGRSGVKPKNVCFVTKILWHHFYLQGKIRVCWPNSVSSLMVIDLSELKIKPSSDTSVVTSLSFAKSVHDGLPFCQVWLLLAL